MSLYRRGNVWWSRIEMDGIVHQFSTKAWNKNAARTIESAQRTELAKGRVGLTAPTLNEFATRFINSLPGQVSKPTYSFYICHFKTLLDFPALCDCRLDRIDAGVIQEFIQWRRKQPGRGQRTVSPVTVNHNLRTLRRVLGLAAEWGVITKIPKVKLLTGENQRDYVLRDDAIEKFSKEKTLIGRLVPFLCDTGLRRGEALNLTWDAVNFEERCIYIAKGKTKSARRRVPLTKRAESILQALPREGDYVFTVRKQKITGDWISHAFMKVRRRLKLPDTCVLHSCRHTFCTRLGEKGADVFTIKSLAGHSSITISQRYVHATASDAAIALLE
jgi:integrase